MKKYAVLLNRVSTGFQDNKPQETALKEYASSKGYTDFHIIETKESGLIHFRDRKGTNELLDFLENNREYKSVFCTEMSRLGRKEADLHYVKNWFKDHKIQFYLLDKKFQLFNDSGNINAETELLFTLYGYFAENEITQKQDRFRRAKIQLALEGYSISGKRLFGYNREKDSVRNKNKYVINEKESNEIIQIFNWYAQGINNNSKPTSIRLVVLECKKKNFSKYTHSKRNVNKLLKEEGYTGQKITNNKRKNPKYLEGGNEEKYISTSMSLKYPQIISKKLFSQVQNNLSTNNIKSDKSHKHTTILSKIIVCKDCLRYFQGQYRYNPLNGASMSSYRCNYTRTVVSCKNYSSISMRLIDSTIWSIIKDDLPSLWQLIVKIKTDEKNLKKEIKNLEKIIQDKNSNFEINQKKFESLIFIDDNEFNLAKKNYQKVASKIKNEILELKETIQNLKEAILSESSHINKNLDQIILEDIKNIERSKERLKDIINIFIKEIKLVFQDQRYSVITIEYNDINESNSDTIKFYNTVVIDKRITNKIKIVKVLKLIEYRDGKLYLNDTEINIDEAFGLNKENENKLKTILKTRDPNSFLFKPVEYVKLDLYDKNDYSPQIISI
jgi:DNA invertase Pin-like site-specific DNA recombinase